MAILSSKADFNAMVTNNSDGPYSEAPFTLGRHNKWGYLCMWGPGNTVQTPLNLGLVQTFSVQETNDSSFLPQAGSDWLELQIGSRMWRGSGARFHVRGADMKQMVRRSYTKGSNGPQDVDFRYLPFVIAYFFDYSPPNGVAIPKATKAYESVTWVFHKVIITNYTNDLITGPNRLLEERFDFISAGEEFQDMNDNSNNYRSTPAVWRGDFYGPGTGKTPPANTATGAGQNSFNFPGTTGAITGGLGTTGGITAGIN